MKYFSEKLSLLKQKGKEIKNTIMSNIAAKPELTEITPGIYYVPGKFDLKSSYYHAMTLFEQFHIWNFEQKEQDFVADSISRMNFNGQPIYPLISMLELCILIKKEVGPGTKVVLRGAECSLILFMYLYLSGNFEFLEQALIQTNYKLKINKDQTQFQTQHSYLRNCINLAAGLKTNTKSLILKRVTLSKLPIMKKPNQEGVIQKFQPHILVCTGSNKVSFKQYKEEGGRVRMEINHEVVDDVMVVVKHQSNQNVSFVCCRFIFNTNFIEGSSMVVGLIDMDVSQAAEFGEGFNVQLEVEKGAMESRLEETWRNTKAAFNKKSQIAQPLEVPKQVIVESKEVLKDVSKQITTQEEAVEIEQEANEAEVITSSAITKLMQQEDNQSAEDIDDYIRKLEESVQH